MMLRGVMSGCLLVVAAYCCAAQRLLVSVPVADIRSEPKDYVLTGQQDPQEQTQVLYGETLWGDAEKNGWWHITAPWQPSFRYAKAWQGYPGWIKKEFIVPASRDRPEPTVVVISTSAVLETPQSNGSFSQVALSLGTELVAQLQGKKWMRVRRVDGSWARLKVSDVRSLEAEMTPGEKRQCVLSQASRFLGTPYLWGGLSTGVDCSGLVHLAFRSCGIVVPRDAREQKMKAEPISEPQLVPGDLIFLADAGEPETARHVSIYAGGDDIIEAPSTGLQVRRIGFKKKLGKTLKEATLSHEVGRRVVSFGRFIHD